VTNETTSTSAAPRSAAAPRTRADPTPAGVVRSVLVLGMHRSGTSALAHVLGLMGIYLGEADELLSPHPIDNPTGYWERADVNAMHDRFLEALGCRWDRIAGFEGCELESEPARILAAQLRSLIQRLDDGKHPWLIKDPRLCLLLPQWQALLPGAAKVVVVRDPREIAASIQSGPRGTLTSGYVIALWEKYLRRLLVDLEGKRALFVSYADLLANPAAVCARLLQGLTDLGVRGLHPPAAQDIATFLDPHLRRSVPRAHVELSSSQGALAAWLNAQCNAPGAVTVGGLARDDTADAVLAEFEATFAYHKDLGRREATVEADRRMGRIEGQLGEIAQTNRRGAEERAELQLQLTQLRHEREQLLAQAGRRDSELLAAGLQRESLQQHADRLQQHANALQQRIDEQDQQTAALQQHADGLQQHVDTLRGHVIGLQRGMSAVQSSWSWRAAAPLRLAGRLLHWRVSAAAEHRLYRWYYSMPGFDAARKRAFVVWLHQHLPWLTRNTLSYQLHARSADAAAVAAPVAVAGQAATAQRRMDEERAAQIIAQLQSPVSIALVMPVFDVDRRWLLAAVDSVRRQFYPHWQLCIADDASTRAETIAALDEVAALGDARIHIRRLPTNLGIAGASNAALAMATGDFVGLLDNDDALTRDALLEVARTIARDDPDVIYSDEDKLEADGRHSEAHFKPDFNIDYFFSINYVCHFSVLRRSLLERIGGFRAGFDGAQDYDLLLRATESGERVAHVPKVLYHWRKTASSTALASTAKPRSWEAGRRALAESLARRGIDATAEAGPYPNTYRVRRAIAADPLVSIIVPFRDKPELLSTCIRSLLRNTDYAHYEILGIDNASAEDATLAEMRTLQRLDARIRFVRYDAPFNYSALNNFAVRHARGEHLLLLNNDTEAIHPGWLGAMLEHSQRAEVGVVGAKLLYPDRRIQHAGVIVGIGGVAGHAHLNEPSDRPGYFARAQLVQDLSAVTFACAMTRRAVFEQLGGLNEQELAIAFNDIDYCLRAREAGYLVVYTPFAELFHHESRTRGYEDNPEKQARFFREITYMQRRHQAILASGDPCYNPNLRLDTGDFSARPGYVDALPI